METFFEFGFAKDLSTFTEPLREAHWQAQQLAMEAMQTVTPQKSATSKKAMGAMPQPRKPRSKVRSDCVYLAQRPKMPKERCDSFLSALLQEQKVQDTAPISLNAGAKAAGGASLADSAQDALNEHLSALAGRVTPPTAAHNLQEASARGVTPPTAVQVRYRHDKA
eukprot:2821060-Rhodomonas_salina.3